MSQHTQTSSHPVAAPAVNAGTTVKTSASVLQTRAGIRRRTSAAMNPCRSHSAHLHSSAGAPRIRITGANMVCNCPIPLSITLPIPSIHLSIANSWDRRPEQRLLRKQRPELRQVLRQGPRLGRLHEPVVPTHDAQVSRYPGVVRFIPAVRVPPAHAVEGQQMPMASNAPAELPMGPAAVVWKEPEPILPMG